MMLIHSPTYTLVIAVLLSSVQSQIYLPCDIIPVPGCTCLNPEHPIVRCQNLNLTWFPRLSPNVTTIHTLDLSHNQLTFLPSGVLSLNKNLKRLDLSHNNIRSIHRHSLQGLEQTLEVLDLSHNNITFVPIQFGNKRGVLNWSLRILKLASNLIQLIYFAPFYNLKNLQQLHLEGNHISRISDQAWQNLNSIKELRISLRRFFVTSVPTQHLQSLEAIHVSGAKPQFMGVIQTWLVKFRHLKHLELSSMKLNDGHLTQNSLSNFSAKLEFLSLRNNLLKHIPGKMLSSLIVLKSLDLSGNRIAKFSMKADYRVPAQLERFNLSQNNLRRVNPAAIVNLEYAREIDLSENSLSVINFNRRWLQRLPMHLKLRIGENPLQCNCRNNGIKTLIGRQVERSNGHLYLAEIYSTLRCAPGGESGNKLMVNVPSSKFECKTLKPKRDRKKEQSIYKFTEITSKADEKKKTHFSDHERHLRFQKPITSIFYNRNVDSYLDSEANLDIPEEIQELLFKRKPL